MVTAEEAERDRERRPTSGWARRTPRSRSRWAARPRPAQHELDRTMSRGAAHDGARGDAAHARRPAAARARRLRRCTASSSRSWSGAARRSRTRTAGSTGRTPRRSPSPRCSRSGVPIRLTGQDTERGTFSQRHAGAARLDHRRAAGARCRRCATRNAPFELHNSPLSEQACLGFEYGYSVQAPDALVLWEAQFGDFVNSAQVIIDQFLISGLAKWGQTSRAHPAAARTATRARGPSTRAPGSSASCRWRPRATSAWPTAPRRRSTSTCCAARRWCRSRAR